MTSFFVWDVADNDLESTVLDMLERLQPYLRKAGVPGRTHLLHDWSDSSLEEAKAIRRIVV